MAYYRWSHPSPPRRLGGNLLSSGGEVQRAAHALSSKAQRTAQHASSWESSAAHGGVEGGATREPAREQRGTREAAQCAPAC